MVKLLFPVLLSNVLDNVDTAIIIYSFNYLICLYIFFVILITFRSAITTLLPINCLFRHPTKLHPPKRNIIKSLKITAIQFKLRIFMARIKRTDKVCRAIMYSLGVYVILFIQTKPLIEDPLY